MSSAHDKPTPGDSGLQPERTDLAWGRTTLSLMVAAAVFLRWMPHHGWFVGSLVAASAITALAIGFTRKGRFYRAVHGIDQEALVPGIASTAAVAASVVVLAGLGIFSVMLLPLRP